jgi:cellulose synthase/poly-beta-1,6-N-acetylglucosamine synthase-like glycosyltransferase
MSKDLEIPLGKRTVAYRFFEMLPAVLSYGAVVLLVVLSIVNPLFAAGYLLIIATTVLVKALSVAFHTLGGSKKLGIAQKVNWARYLKDLERPEDTKIELRRSSTVFQKQHAEYMHIIQQSRLPYPKPTEVYNAVIVAFYNENYEVLRDTVESIVNTTYDTSRIMLMLAYEERGGPATKEIAKRLQREFSALFYAFEIVEHPKGLSGEITSGKGGNITFAGKYLQVFLDKKKIKYSDVIVTTLDSDNRPDVQYFDYLTYEYIVHQNRKHLSFQPVSLFLNNIWDVPAPMRVVATGNSFWNIISAMRPHTLRNFASHAQPMDALVEMKFWSTRTIVEDGHQYWRSYFHFKGRYDVVPIFVPIYQDAVMSDTYGKTLKAQFIQLRRWAYGASDIPYVAVRLFSMKSGVNFFAGFTRLVRLVDSHVTLACIPLLITFGGWIPILVSSEATRSVAANQLPEVLGVIQRLAMIGLLVTIFLTFKMLPPRPARYKRHRSVGMLLQWLLMPITALTYSAASAYYSQTRLLLGKYMTKFDVTEKATMLTKEQHKQENQ